jgi:gamma-glutamylcyclotransferase (GGCT)/AIG2-like uncharacterized protein YtfP
MELGNKETLVFVYGTLKPGGHYHEEYCGGFQFESEKARVRGQLFDFPQLGYPGAVEATDTWIQGYLFAFAHPESEVLAKLDHLEGYHPETSTHQNEYYRQKVPYYIVSESLKSGEAWCYFMEAEAIKCLGGVPISNGDWPVTKSRSQS